jgi:hypothetical protein
MFFRPLFSPHVDWFSPNTGIYEANADPDTAKTVYKIKKVSTFFGGKCLIPKVTGGKENTVPVQF